MKIIVSEILERCRFWSSADRLGPDIPLSHWRLHFKSTMVRLCEAKFLRFGLGAEFRPGAYAICCSKISLGNRVVIRPGSMLFADSRDEGAGITIADDVLLGSGVHIYVHNHRFDAPSLPIVDQGYYPSQPVTLEAGSWIGAGSVILPGVTVGKNAVVGAGSIVTRDVPPFTLVAGNPARVIRKIESQK